MPGAGARGQHFLRRQAAAALVASCRIRPDDLVVDLGAGRGALTEVLAPVAGRVIAVEVDPRLADEARRRVARWPSASVVTADLFNHRRPREPHRVVANIPFGRTTAILGDLLDRPGSPLVDAHLVVQWGAGVGLAAARPGRPDVIAWSAWFDLRLGRRIPAAAFNPRPRVDAVVLEITRKHRPLVPAGAALAYRRFLGAVWNRGPSVRRGLRGVLTDRQFVRVASDGGFARSARPGDLDARQWAAVFLACRSHSGLTRS